MIVCGFWTTGTPYEAEGAAMKASAEAFGLQVDLAEHPHPGSWGRAALLFPTVIKNVRRRHPDEVILYLDADARVMQMGLAGQVEEWGKAGPDLGLYYLPKSPRSRFPSGDELCTGTMVWWPTERAAELLAAWEEACSRPEAVDVFGLDQEILQGLVEARPGLRVIRLPHEWCWMDRISPARFGNLAPEIYHGQASRRYKGLV